MRTYSTQPSRVLVVDDEQNIVNAVRRELSTPPLGRHRYAIEAFTNPIEALERAQVEKFEVVLSDYRMPKMDGLDFIKALSALEMQKDCVPLVLSGQTDIEALIRMINETHIFRFIPKPWSSYFLKSSTSQAVDFRNASIENRNLAWALRQSSIEAPRGLLNPIDQILIVDDDLSVGNAIARCLSQRNLLDELLRYHQKCPTKETLDPGSTKINVQVTPSPHHALKMAASINFSCIIADYRMPNMDGASFLSAFADKQPDCAAILISGYKDMEGIVNALDLGQIQFFIAKPWDDFALRSAVAQILAKRRMLLENRALSQLHKNHQSISSLAGTSAH